MYKTPTPKAKDIERKWYIVDLKDQTLGRVATRIADTIRGKNKACFTPHLDCGDYVIVINAKELKLTGAKHEQKRYTTHSGYPGAIKHETAKKVLEEKPEKIVLDAVAGMLPRNRLKKVFLSKLKIFDGAEHNHEAQKPTPLEV